ncbi:MAG: SAM-dependent methyltransferase [Dehalococcoidales bacterium]|nr:SAM-dependent methyltransferase [Dehalococcoidales bacterium]
MGQSGETIKDTPESIQLKPIGIVKNRNFKASWGTELQALTWQERVAEMHEQRQSVSEIVVDPEFEDMLAGTEEFSHLAVIYWAHLIPEEKRNEAIIYPFGDKNNFPPVGIFATHSPARPNGILVTAVRLLERNGNVLKVTGLDALNGSPVLDIKSHVPDQVNEVVRTPEWHKKMREAFK